MTETFCGALGVVGLGLAVFASVLHVVSQVYSRAVARQGGW